MKFGNDNGISHADLDIMNLDHLEFKKSPRHRASKTIQQDDFMLNTNSQINESPIKVIQNKLPDSPKKGHDELDGAFTGNNFA